MSQPGEEPLQDLVAPSDAFRVALPNFEGPLDLLLHLIREHKVDIFDIPLALITEKYLEHLERMREVNLDIAGEFLVMASTLAHIKSRLLLPRQESHAQQGPVMEPEDPRDPRAELVRRLLEYQKYRAVAEELGRHPVLGRDVFVRQAWVAPIPLSEDEVGFTEISVYRLIEALDRVLKRLEPKFQHEVVRERMSLSDAIHRIADKLRAEGQAAFYALFEGQRHRQQVIVTFLALLEMCKLKLIRLTQDEGCGDITVWSKGDALAQLTEVDDGDYK